jgi:phage tail sheath gpL-like
MAGVDITAVARVLGIESTFQDLRTGSILNLPMRIAICAQGATDSVYSAEKWTLTTAAAAGARYGYGSPIHRAALRLKPVTGDGVGSIPVEVLPLSDAGGAVAAAGSIDVSGTQTTAASNKIVVSRTKSLAFTFTANMTDTAKFRAMMTALQGVLELPVTPKYVYDTVTASAVTGTGNGTIGTLSVTAATQPTPGAWVLKCTSIAAHGGVFSLTDPDGSVVGTGLTMTGGTGATTALSSNGLNFSLTDGSTDFAVNDYFTITVPVTNISLTAKWKGASGNGIVIDVEDGAGGTTFTIVQPTGGLTNPTVSSALARIGNTWTTFVLNGLNLSDTSALTEYATFAEGRRGVTVHKPLVVFTGCVDAVEATAYAVCDARKTDRTNSQLVSPGSDDLPIDVAARQLARIAVVANNDPASDYGARQATGLTPGDDNVQWDWEARDRMVKRGSSTVEIVDGVVQLGDVITFYHPTGESPPGYRYVCDIVKEMNVIYNLALKFASDDWVGKPLIPDDQATTNPNARKPSTAKQVVSNMIDALGLAAIISDPATAKDSIVCSIDSQNPKRLNVTFTLQFSGNTNIVSIPFNWGFYYGVQAAA